MKISRLHLGLAFFLGGAAAAVVACSSSSSETPSPTPTLDAGTKDGSSSDATLSDTGIEAVDANVGEDAAIDAGVDANEPTTNDAGIDAGVDAGHDAGIDSGTDSGTDSGIDAGIDSGVDSGIDAGIDSGIDAGVDSGSSFTVVNGCGESDYTDQTAQSDSRVVQFFVNGNYAYTPPCLTIKVGQSVTFSAASGTSFANHPLEATGNTSGNPVPTTPLSSGTSMAYTYNTAGVFGYDCNFHKGFGMKGAIQVIP